MDSKVYVNGKFVGHYPSGYNHFSYDITEFLTRMVVKIPLLFK